MSRVVPGLLGIFRLGTLVVMCDRTSRDVPRCPRTSWDLGGGGPYLIVALGGSSPYVA